ncbi:hybrid sensor histidine kinase/response regulator, partial [Pseudoalteromonas ruthenica]
DIAEQSNDANAQPYIIAVTANALKGEKERCIATGMNDYITKPVELNVLEATLMKWQEKHANNLSAPDSSASGVNTNHTNTPETQESNNLLIQELPSDPEVLVTPAINLETLNKYVNHDEAKQLRF